MMIRPYRINLGTTSGHLESENFVDRPCKRHHRSTLVFFPLCFASRGSPVRSRPRPPTLSLLARHLPNSFLPQPLSFAPNCARTVHEPGYCSATVHIGAANRTSAATGVISLARRFSFSRASRFICNFIWEYFLKTCASLWRSIWVTHSSATPPALSLVAYVERRS